MATYLGKNEKGEEIFGYDLQGSEVKAVGDNEIELIGSTEDMDRDGEVLKMDGWDLRAFKKNPVVLPSHLYFQPAIGKAKVSKRDGKLIFRIEFPPEGINPVADVYKGLYKSGFMTASSVGFLPREWSWGEKENEPRRTFTKQELLEISLVSVPANPNALVTAKGISDALAQKKITNKDVRVLEKFLEEAMDLSRETGVFYLPEVKGGDSDGEEKAEKKATEKDEKEQSDFEKRICESVKKTVKETIEEVLSKSTTIQTSSDANHYIDFVIANDQGSGKEQKLDLKDIGKSLKDKFKI